MKNIFLLVLVFLGGVWPLCAQDGATVRGIVTTVVGNTITVASDKAGEMAYTIDAQTKIVALDGSAAKLGDVAVGATVEVTTGSNANEAAEVRVVPAKAPKDKI